MKSFRSPLIYLLPPLAAGFLYGLGKTLDLTILNEASHAELRKQFPNLIYTLWHGRLLLLVYSHRNRGITVLVSQSQDGEYLSRMLQWARFRTVRGSSTRGGVRGLLGLIKAIREGYDVAITPDGPQGPAHHVQPGVIYLAQQTGAPIVPVTASAKRYKEFQSWDRFLVPYPFSKAVVLFGEPFFVPSKATEQMIVDYQEKLQKELNRITEEADQYCRWKIS
ncbi:MAG TPA: lysophospholipid acyltransferase family protein [Candidatus Limnocylindrales bacterium]|nr:lysophospholipid acyltransferase family protein [Candidatus Limnocylindrales bacterium]